MKNIIIKNIDLEALKEQKQSLISAIETYEYYEKSDLLKIDAKRIKTHLDNLNGILSLLDHISDADIEGRTIKPKYKIDDRVNVLNHDSLNLNKLIISSLEYKTSDEMHKALGVEFTPEYYYSFHGIALQAKESDLVK